MGCGEANYASVRVPAIFPRTFMIHVIFCSSAAGTLRQALRSRRCRERVVDLTECLNWGLIGSENFRERAAWFDKNVPSVFSEGWGWIVEHIEDFTSSVTSDPDRTIWLDPRTARELSGLYWYLDRFGASDARMVIAPGLQSFCGLGVLDMTAIGELLDNCRREHWNQVRFPESAWGHLTADHSLIRVVADGRLHSEPNDTYDHYILRRCSRVLTDWTRLVGNAMIDIFDSGHSVDDLFVRWRIGELIQLGAMVADGRLPRYGE